METNTKSSKKQVKATSLNFGGLGWLLIIYIALTFFVCGLGGSIQNLTAGMFEGIYGWDQAIVLSLPSIGGWIGVVFIFIFGMLLRNGKLNIRLTILFSAVILGICYIFMGRTSSLAVYAALFCIYYAMYQIWAQMANQALCNNWFPRKKGVAIGFATMGFPLAPSLGLILFITLLSNFGMDNAFLFIGVAAIVIGVLAVLIFRDYPEKLGRFPDNDPSLTREEAEKELAEGREMVKNSPWSMKRLLKAKEVWLVFIPCGFIGFFAAGSISQVVPRLLEAGYSSDAATSMITVCALIAVPGSFLIGFIDSKLGAKKSFILSMAACVFGGIMYAIPNPVTIWIGLIIIGIALGGSSNFAMSFTTGYFGRYHFQKAFGVTLTVTQIISSAGSLVIACLAAAKGYSFTYIVVSVICAVMIVLVLPVKDNFAAKYEAKFAKEDGKA